jgi:cellulose 1,4-beta-cellobiosidase
MPTPTRTNPPPTSPAASCAVTYTIQNDWGTGFTGYVVITNTGSSSINGWTLEWSFPGNQAIYGMWNGSYTQNGQTVAVTNLEYNAAINPNGGSVNFGFNASYSGANAKPVGSQLNGVSCVGP